MVAKKGQNKMLWGYENKMVADIQNKTMHKARFTQNTQVMGKFYPAWVHEISDTAYSFISECGQLNKTIYIIS